MSTNNICLYKEVAKSAQESTKLLDCVLKGLCAVIRPNYMLLWQDKRIIKNCWWKKVPYLQLWHLPCHKWVHKCCLVCISRWVGKC